MNTIRKKGMALFLIFTLFANVIMAVPESKASDGGSGEEKQEFTGSGYKLELSESSGWENGYVAEVVVTNTGEKELRNWSVLATVKEGEIGNSWNAGNKRMGTDEVLFESESHNMTLRSGESADFGFQVTGGTYSDIVSLKLVQGKVLATSQAGVEFKETSSWDGHKIIEGTITNNSETTIRDWSLTFETEGKITNIWNAVVFTESDDFFSIQNQNYNAVIEAGASVTFGFELSYDTDSFQGIHNVRIYAGEGTETTGGEKPPEQTPVITPSAIPSATAKPVMTETPENTPVTTEPPEKEDDISEDDIELVQVENRDWNMDMIHANAPEVEAAKETTGRKIKVTMLDSGINYSREINVAERRNFVEGEDEMTCLFEDGSGHGTAIAEVLASNPEAGSGEEDGNVEVIDEFGEYTYYSDVIEDGDDEEDKEVIDAEDENTVSLGDLLDSGYDWTEGVNPNIELYSGKVLDADNETTVDRVIEGIEWAIENDTDILSLSIGMDKGSVKLHKAIQKAAAGGMLIIAAVGDDENIDYPAAYPEVMAVGTVNSMGETNGISAEVVAPGDSIVSRGIFDSMEIFSGSSMAVPHVVGLASILWQKDTSKGAEFIRGLIDVSANRIENDESCEYGLIDCSYALESYERFEKQVQENGGILNNISKDKHSEEVMEAVAEEIENQSEVETEEEMEKLHGNWDYTEHSAFVSDKYRGKWTNHKKYVAILRSGLSFVDKEKDNPECYGMREHPWFHGFFGGVKNNDGSGGKTLKSNYMTSFRTLVELADTMRQTGAIKELDTESKYPAVQNALTGIQKAFANPNKIGSQTWKDINRYCAKSGGSVPKDCRSLLIYGMALHTLGDTFSHSSFGMTKGTGDKKGSVVWKRYTHSGSKTGKWYADNTESRRLRYDSAKRATKKALNQIQVNSQTGLVGYNNMGTAVDAFYAGTEFKKLKKYHVAFMDKLGKKKELPKLSYFKEGYALKDFSNCYEKETEITGRTSANIEKYKKYVDKAELESRMKNSAVVELGTGTLLPGLKTGSVLKLKTDDKTIVSQTVTGEKMAFVVSKDSEYEVVSSGASVCTIKEGVLYDAIGRRMPLSEPEEDDDGAEVDEELDEDENLDVCGILNYVLSTDCLIKGRVVWFDYTASSNSLDDMPGLAGATVSLTSRDTGKVYTTKTKQDGSYQIQLPAGKYDATYEKGEEYTVINQFVEAKGDLYNNGTVELVGEDWFGEGYVDGVFYDKSTGLPLSDAFIQIYKGIGYYEDSPVNSVTTDEKGYFATDFLEAGAYTFVVTKAGYITKYFYQSVIGWVRSYVPGIEMEREEE